MKANKPNTKLSQNKINNKSIPFNSNPFQPKKYYHCRDSKNIVNIKNNPFISNNNKNSIKNEKIKKEEEDNYNRPIYNQKLIISRSISEEKLYKCNLNINMAIGVNIERKWNSIDERYKTLKIFYFHTKYIFHKNKIKKLSDKDNNSNNAKKYKFSKKNKFSKNKIKCNNNHQKFMNMKDIMNNTKNDDDNNIFYKEGDINESNIILTNNNTITNKTVANISIPSFKVTDMNQNSYYKLKNNSNSYVIKNLPIIVDNNPKSQFIKNNNKIKYKKGESINKQIKNVKNDEKLNSVFVRRILLEEKFYIDSKGEKRTLYIKKISPIIQTKEILNNTEKKLIRNTKNVIEKNNYIKNNENTFINHNDINLNFNVCSFQKINFNSNNAKKNKLLNPKFESFEEDNRYNLNNNTSINDILILQNVKNILNVKKSKKGAKQEKKEIIYKTENHKSHQRLFSNSKKKKYIIYLSGKKKKQSIINYNINNIQRSSTKESNFNNMPLKFLLAFPKCSKNKGKHRKTKSNIILPNNIKYEKFKLKQGLNGEEAGDNFLQNKRSLSYVCKSSLYDLFNKLNNNKNSKDSSKKDNCNQIPIIPIKNRKNEFLIFSASPSGIVSKYHTKLNSINKSKYIRLKNNNKSKVPLDKKESCNISQRSNSLNRIRNNNNINSNYIKCIFNYLRSIIPNNGRNKSHRNFLFKNCDKFDLDNYIIEKKIIHSNRMNYQ